MLKGLREKAGYTQAELANEFGFASPQFISNIERGLAQLPTKHFRKMSKLLKVSPNVLINFHLKRSEERLRRILKCK